MFQAIEISKTYRKGEISSVILSNINLEINEGEYISIFGPSGSGKTSLLNIVGLLDSPDSGEVLFHEKNILSLNPKERLNLRRKEIGYIFSDANLIEELTVAENVELPLLYQKIKKKDRQEQVSAILGEMNLLHKKKEYPQNLTSLQQQKTAIARALVINPSLILADEPTGNLNSTEGNEILDLLSKINDNGTSIFLFSHEKRIAERARKTVQLFDGHLLLDSSLK
ncbi:ABC transporter ATP-binding protein [Labilibacter marinus]|uniref:ABC transporter ATP-binding protein n=1 Tax=Labilibacter marinus TaxID=1477105 RepID=UPI000835D856|nr:ABC transporter ATP-binding protein [Labilibacter marinus]